VVWQGRSLMLPPMPINVHTPENPDTLFIKVRRIFQHAKE
jgi:hypothetical protein